MRQAKVSVLTQGGGTSYSENKIHFVLLGDPALKLGVPDYELVVDSINGMKVGDGLPFADFKAGSVARVSGHVADASAEGTRRLCARYE